MVAIQNMLKHVMTFLGIGLFCFGDEKIDSTKIAVWLVGQRVS